MRIAIDARRAGRSMSGIGRYTECLLQGLSLIESPHQYVRIDETAVPCDIYSIRNQIVLPSFLTLEKAEIYHSPDASVPILAKKDMPYAVTVHDLIPWKYPHLIPKAKKNRLRWLFRIIFREVMKRADRIIAVSNATAADIEECFPADSSRIRVVYNGVDPAFFDPHCAEKGGYLLYAGRRDPYKNIAAALKAYARACEKYGIPHRFLILGEEDPRYKEAETAVELLNLRQRVTFSGHVSHGDLLKAYRGADLLVMPSACEGFGYPVIEAMACGVPVIISRAPALVEVAGGHAVSVNPDDTEEFAEAIHAILTDSTLSRRLSTEGREHAGRFTIEKMARETLRVYEEC
jgi:glycosyltransferase involved in cell wall biosynthesis